MTADEIRRKAALCDKSDTGLRTLILVEIAAQLAELNHNLSPAGKAEAAKLTAQINGHF